MKAPANGAAAKPPLPIAISTRCSPRWHTRRCAPRTVISKRSTIVWRDGVGKNAPLARSNTACWLPSISCFAITGPTRILVLTTLINSILNNEFVTMSADSENSDKEWSFHLSLMQRKPPPQPNRRRRHEEYEERTIRNAANFSTIRFFLRALRILRGDQNKPTETQEVTHAAANRQCVR